MVYEAETKELVVRKNIYDLVQIRRQTLGAIETMRKADKEVDEFMESILSYNFYNLIRLSQSRTYSDFDAQEVDKRLWQYLIKIYNLEKYMLCTEYEKMCKQIEDYNFPEFTIDNAEGWLLSLKAVIYDNVQKLIEDVFDRITRETYRTGSGWYNSVKKKRNNNGVDKFFILSTQDHCAMRWYSGRPTITDDLEKACYIMDGKELPETTIKSLMSRGKIWESENDYFWIRICQNGNTHYKIKEPILTKLNLYGARKGVIGENIKIKIFEKQCGGGN